MIPWTIVGERTMMPRATPLYPLILKPSIVNVVVTGICIVFLLSAAELRLILAWFINDRFTIVNVKIPYPQFASVLTLLLFSRIWYNPAEFNVF
jgi:hypothetical protein